MEGLLDKGGAATVRKLWTFISLKIPGPFPTFYMRKCYFVPAMLRRHAKRYASLRISDYQNHIDPAQETQFCACTFALPDGTRLYRFAAPT